MFDNLKSLFAGERKKFAAAPLVSLHTVGRPQWTPRNYASLAREGFAGNAIGYRCVRMIAEAASSVPLIIYDGDKELASHPLKQLLARPNPAQPGASWLRISCPSLLVAGIPMLKSQPWEASPATCGAAPGRDKVVAGNNRLARGL